MGLFDWLAGEGDDDDDKMYEELADKGPSENIKEIVNALKESIESGQGTSWFDKLFGVNEEEDKGD